MNMNYFFRIQNFFNQIVFPYMTKERIAFLKKTAFLISLSFLTAILVVTWFSVYFVKMVSPHPQVEVVRKGILSGGGSKASIVLKNIIARNIFNISGEIPYEDTPEGSRDSLVENFDKVACTPGAKLPVELLGIIYTSNPKTTLVTLKDATIAFADVYKVGENIVGYESFSVYKVTNPSTAEFREGNKKICLSLAPVDRNVSAPAGSQSNENYSLAFSFVNDELGPGFSKILSTARLVPEIVSGKAVGFKIFAISGGSLFDKIKLENGDVITNVNGINLEDASQGFKVYEAFQEDSEITLQIIRNGNNVIKKVTVQ